MAIPPFQSQINLLTNISRAHMQVLHTEGEVRASTQITLKPLFCLLLRLLIRENCLTHLLTHKGRKFQYELLIYASSQWEPNPKKQFFEKFSVGFFFQLRDAQPGPVWAQMLPFLGEHLGEPRRSVGQSPPTQSGAQAGECLPWGGQAGRAAVGRHGGGWAGHSGGSRPGEGPRGPAALDGIVRPARCPDPN